MKVIKFFLFGSLTFLLINIAFAVRASMNGTYESSMAASMAGMVFIFIGSLAAFIVAKIIGLLFGRKPAPADLASVTAGSRSRPFAGAANDPNAAAHGAGQRPVSEETSLPEELLTLSGYVAGRSIGRVRRSLARKTCEHCRSRIHPAATVCRYCQRDVAP